LIWLRRFSRLMVEAFDVDETLITVKSMFEFLRFWLARCWSARTASACPPHAVIAARRRPVARAAS